MGKGIRNASRPGHPLASLAVKKKNKAFGRPITRAPLCRLYSTRHGTLSANCALPCNKQRGVSPCTAAPLPTRRTQIGAGAGTGRRRPGVYRRFHASFWSPPKRASRSSGARGPCCGVECRGDKDCHILLIAGWASSSRAAFAPRGHGGRVSARGLFRWSALRGSAPQPLARPAGPSRTCFGPLLSPRASRPVAARARRARLTPVKGQSAHISFI